MTAPNMRPARPRDPRPTRARQVAKAIDEIDALLAVESLQPVANRSPAYIDLLLASRHRLKREQDR